MGNIKIKAQGTRRKAQESFKVQGASKVQGTRVQDKVQGTRLRKEPRTKIQDPNKIKESIKNKKSITKQKPLRTV